MQAADAFLLNSDPCPIHLPNNNAKWHQNSRTIRSNPKAHLEERKQHVKIPPTKAKFRRKDMGGGLKSKSALGVSGLFLHSAVPQKEQNCSISLFTGQWVWVCPPGRRDQVLLKSSKVPRVNSSPHSPYLGLLLPCRFFLKPSPWHQASWKASKTDLLASLSLHNND